MNLLNELLQLHHSHPSWAPEELATDGYAEKVSGRWRLTDQRRIAIQPDLDRVAAVLYPDDTPKA
jgi:hypothetical protein